MQSGRYCPPRICWCGKCEWYKPNPYRDPFSPQSIALSDSLRRKAKTMAKRLERERRLQAKEEGEE